MDLYIANCSLQNQIVAFMIPEEKTPRQQTIPIGQQIKVAAGRDGLSTAQIDAIVEALRPYGMLAADEIGRSKAPANTCYSVGKPVSVGVMRALLLRNETAQIEQGKKMRQITAVAATEDARRNSVGQQRLKTMDISIVEQEPRAGYTGKPIGEGFRIDLEAMANGGGAPLPPRSARRRRG